MQAPGSVSSATNPFFPLPDSRRATGVLRWPYGCQVVSMGAGGRSRRAPPHSARPPRGRPLAAGPVPVVVAGAAPAAAERVRGLPAPLAEARAPQRALGPIAAPVAG